MMFQFYFKKMGISDTLKQLSQRKLSDLVERFVGANGLVRITFQTEKNQQRVLCLLQGHNGQNFRASASSDNMYANLDAVAHKLETQLQRVKTRGSRYKSRLTATRLRLASSADNPDWEADTTLNSWDDENEPLLRHLH
ncbi:MAG: ribosome-associated translation inhibitor RaiA [Chitinophagaceae bacterium]|nr:ribosome-associated translation inhibitor RaiA [Oligoflexus sp.]